MTEPLVTDVDIAKANLDAVEALDVESMPNVDDWLLSLIKEHLTIECNIAIHNEFLSMDTGWL